MDEHTNNIGSAPRSRDCATDIDAWTATECHTLGQLVAPACSGTHPQHTKSRPAIVLPSSPLPSSLHHRRPMFVFVQDQRLLESISLSIKTPSGLPGLKSCVGTFYFILNPSHAVVTLPPCFVSASNPLVSPRGGVVTVWAPFEHLYDLALVACLLRSGAISRLDTWGCRSVWACSTLVWSLSYAGGLLVAPSPCSFRQDCDKTAAVSRGLVTPQCWSLPPGFLRFCRDPLIW